MVKSLDCHGIYKIWSQDPEYKIKLIFNNKKVIKVNDGDEMLRAIKGYCDSKIEIYLEAYDFISHVGTYRQLMYDMPTQYSWVVGAVLVNRFNHYTYEELMVWDETRIIINQLEKFLE